MLRSVHWAHEACSSSSEPMLEKALAMLLMTTLETVPCLHAYMHVHAQKHTLLKCALHSCQQLCNSWYVQWCMCKSVYYPVSAQCLKRPVTSNHLWPQLLTFQLLEMHFGEVTLIYLLQWRCHCNLKQEEVIWHGEPLGAKQKKHNEEFMCVIKVSGIDRIKKTVSIKVLKEKSTLRCYHR